MRIRQRMNTSNELAYRGINVLVLWSAAMEKGYAAPVWMTYRQATELNLRRDACRSRRKDARSSEGDFDA
jgi:antirestriction protein ArdC